MGSAVYSTNVEEENVLMKMGRRQLPALPSLASSRGVSPYWKDQQNLWAVTEATRIDKTKEGCRQYLAELLINQRGKLDSG